MLIWKIAWRNLFRHKEKSLVIGIILFIGAFLMIVGNAFIEGSKRGLEENMVNRFLGHLAIISAKEKQQEVIFGSGRSLKVIPNYQHIKTILERQEYITSFLPMLRGVAMMLNEAGRTKEIQVLGVNFKDYQQIFLNNIVPFEGELLKEGERGLLIGHTMRNNIYEFQKVWLVPQNTSLNRDHLTPEAQKADWIDALTIKHDLVLLGLSSSSFNNDIRLPVKGIIRLQQLNFLTGGLSFMDVESYRECFGHVTAANNLSGLSDEEKALLEIGDSEDDLFSETTVIEERDTTSPGYTFDTMQQQMQRTATTVDLDQGAYNLVLMKLRPDISLSEAKKRLQRVLSDANVGVKVLTWKEAVGGWAQAASILQGALMAFVMCIFFVAIIIIMNTLSMAALERTSEIGMMRAIGARKHFISWMFFAETSSLSFIFGGLGIVTGGLVVWGLGTLNISVAEDQMMSLLFGGDTLHPVVDILSIVVGGIQLALVTLVAMLYPIAVARRITPLDAIARD